MDKNKSKTFRNTHKIKRLKYNDFLKVKNHYRDYYIKKVTRNEVTNLIDEVRLEARMFRDSEPIPTLIVSCKDQMVLNWLYNKNLPVASLGDLFGGKVNEKANLEESFEDLLDEEVKKKEVDGEDNIKELKDEIKKITNKVSIGSIFLLVILNIVIIYFFQGGILLFFLSTLLVLIAYLVFTTINVVAIKTEHREELDNKKSLLKQIKFLAVKRKVEVDKLKSDVEGLKSKNEAINHSNSNVLHPQIKQLKEENKNLKETINSKESILKSRHEEILRSTKEKLEKKLIDIAIEKSILESNHENEIELLESNHQKEIGKISSKANKKYQRKLNEILKEKETLESKHRKELNKMEKELNDKLKKFISDISKKYAQELGETKEKIEKEILGNVFNSNSEPFNESENLSAEDYYRKQKEREEELSRKEEKLKTDKRNQDFVEKIFGMTNNMNERIFNTEKKVVDFREVFNRKLTDLESKIVQGIASLDVKIETSIANVTKSISEVKIWANENFSTLKLWFKEEVLKISEKHIRLVNKFEEFDIRHKGDMREMQMKFNEFDIRYKANMQDIQNQIKETYLYVDAKAFAAHERILALDYAIKNEGLRLDRKIDSGILGLQQADMKNEKLLQDIQHNLEKGLLYAEAARKENQFVLEKQFYESQAQNEQRFNNLDNESRRREDRVRFDTERMFDDLSYRTTRNFDALNNKADQNYESLNYKTDYHVNDLNHKTEIKYRDLKYAMESNISDLKYDNEQKLYIVNTNLDKKLDELSNKYNIKMGDLHHLIELKDYKHSDFINKHVNQIKADITNMKAEQKMQYANLDAKYKVELNDLKTLHMKHLYEQDQKIMKVINKIESFHNDISGLSVRMESLKVGIQKMGVDNEKVKQDAQHLLNSVQLRMDSIDNSLKLAKNTSRLIEERIDTKVRGDLLRLKEITIDQESKLKEIAFAKEGIKMIYDDYNNKAKEKELEVKRLHDNIEMMNKRISDERRAIQIENKLVRGEEAANKKLMQLQYDRDTWKKEAQDNNREANMYRKAANYYQKKYWGD